MIADATTAAWVHTAFAYAGMALGAARWRRSLRQQQRGGALAPGNFGVLVGLLLGAALGNKLVFLIDRPDVVLGHFTEMIGWMEECGAKVPDTHGFVSLNVLYKTRPCAGLDQQPRQLGARAVEQLIAQLQRNERGVPEWATTTTIPARWVEGPTVRKP